MTKTRRDFLRNTLLGAGLVSGAKAWAGTNPGFAPLNPPSKPYQAMDGDGALPSKQDSRYPDKPLGRARIEPSLAKLQPGAQQQFRAIIAAPTFSYAHLAENVTWTVNDVEGGSSQVGTIDARGLYRAPAQVPVPHEVHVCAKVEGVMNPLLFATVLVGASEVSYTMKSSWTDEAHVMKYPHSISLDPQGNLLIADSTGNGAYRFSREGKLLTVFGFSPRHKKGAHAPEGSVSKHPSLAMGYFGGMDPGYFSAPRVAISDKEGNVYVVDTEERRPQIQVFDTEGNFKYAFGQHGNLPGYLIRVHGMAFDSKGLLHAEDVENCRVNTYEPDGKFVGSWGHEGALPGQLNAPHCLYIDPNDEPFVIGYYGPTQKFTSDGHYLLSFAHANPPDHPISFQSLFGDRWGNVYVPMRDEGLQKYNNVGEFVGWVTRGVGTQWGTVAHDGTIYLLPTSTSKSQEAKLPTVAVYAPR
ncbi:MAG TPA: NHL repeat-containing protein [Terriglobia bacterium]|nr:NHL repeat-containing protein [Terriglobia bacterium]